jgi:catechol 2,3-dioxygenase-like lactoylglutathione lyase family enzyme
MEEGMTMTINGIDVVSVPVSDQNRAKQFYTETLGFTVVADTSMGDQRWVQLAPPGGGAAITLVTWFETMPPGSMKGLVLACEDADATYAEVVRNGGEVKGQVEDAEWGARWFAIGDPDGNGIVIQERS